MPQPVGNLFPAFLGPALRYARHIVIAAEAAIQDGALPVSSMASPPPALQIAVARPLPSRLFWIAAFAAMTAGVFVTPNHSFFKPSVCRGHRHTKPSLAQPSVMPRISSLRRRPQSRTEHCRLPGWFHRRRHRSTLPSPTRQIVIAAGAAIQDGALPAARAVPPPPALRHPWHSPGRPHPSRISSLRRRPQSRTEHCRLPGWFHRRRHRSTLPSPTRQIVIAAGAAIQDGALPAASTAPSPPSPRPETYENSAPGLDRTALHNVVMWIT